MASETVVSVGSGRWRGLVGVAIALLVGAGVGWWLAAGVDDADPGDDPGPEVAADRWLVTFGADTALVSDGQLRLREVGDAVVLVEGPERDGRGLSVGALVVGWDDLFVDGPPDAALTWAGRTGEAGAGVVLFAPTRDESTGEVVFGFAVDDDTTLWDEPAPPRTFLRDVRLFVDAPALDAEAAAPFFCDLGPFVDGIPLDGTVKLRLAGRAPDRAVTVDWGDGTVDEVGAGVAEPEHRYGFEPGSEFTITASGGCVDRETISFPGPPS